MNESDTRLHKVDPILKKTMLGVTDVSRIMTEYPITKGKISQTVKSMPKKMPAHKSKLKSMTKSH